VPYLTGQAKESPRKEFFSFSDDRDLVGLRYDNGKAVFAYQKTAVRMKKASALLGPKVRSTGTTWV
jgi:hypothetical protein